MKKIFLLSLLSILLLSTFSQISGNSPEILANINITMIDDVNDNADERGPFFPWEMFLYRYILTEYYAGGWYIVCSGFGPYVCFSLPLESLNFNIRGVAMETIENTYQEMIETIKQQVANREYQGSITRKCAYPDPERGHLTSYILFQMHWDNDPKNPRNGKAKITISKTNDLTM